jgi:peptidoglycan/LPS O-acetylase OafA/YrhL
MGKQEDNENFSFQKDEPINYIQAFSFGWVYKFYATTRCKPWDNRELDALDGIRAKCFVLYTMSQTAVMILFTVLINLFEIFKLLRNFFINIVISANLALEIFLFISVFLGFYKCMQIMDAKQGVLTPLDIFRLWLKKFMRLAPAYYIMWLLIWTCTSRANSGPLWHLAQINTRTCAEDWVPTFYMVGNIWPK